MRFIYLVITMFAKCAWAGHAVGVNVGFESVGAKISHCSGTVVEILTCVDSAAAQSKMIWGNTSFSDWGGMVMRARLKFQSATTGMIAGIVRYTYVPDTKLIAIALKQSSGGADLTITGQISDFTDVEGRRIIAVSPGRTLTIDMPIEVAYPTPGQILKKDFMLEFEYAEYLQ